MANQSMQMIAINQPYGAWSQNACKFKLQIAHRWNICCVKFLGITSTDHVQEFS